MMRLLIIKINRIRKELSKTTKSCGSKVSVCTTSKTIANQITITSILSTHLSRMPENRRQALNGQQEVRPHRR